MANIDPEKLLDIALVKSHAVGDERTVMRSAQEIIALDQFLRSRTQSCDQKTAIMNSLFAYRGQSKTFRDDVGPDQRRFNVL